MRITKHSLAAAVLVLPLVLNAGCVQMPTEKQQVADVRPSIAFRVLNAQAADARVYVDEIDVGAAGDFAEGQAALRVLPGTHLLRVARGSQVLLQEKVYLGDGVNRVFVVQ